MTSGGSERGPRLMAREGSRPARAPGRGLIVGFVIGAPQWLDMAYRRGFSYREVRISMVQEAESPQYRLPLKPRNAAETTGLNRPPIPEGEWRMSASRLTSVLATIATAVTILA